VGRVAKIEPGTKWHRLTYLGEAGRGSNYQRIVSVVCDCGKQKSVLLSNLKSGMTRSCGCLQREAATKHNRAHNTTHGMTAAPEYRCWHAMLWRCSPAATGHGRLYYFLKGIQVCDRWQGPEGLANFCADMGPRPSSRHSVERKNGDLGYSPENCVWALPKEQCRNLSNNRNLTYKGRTMCVSAWAEEVGLERSVLDSRLRLGWSLERALATPVRVYRARQTPVLV
jgi:hypothetical protein